MISRKYLWLIASAEVREFYFLVFSKYLEYHNGIGQGAEVAVWRSHFGEVALLGWFFERLIIVVMLVNGHTT